MNAKKSTSPKNILVLGADGLVGRTVYSYLTDRFGQTVWGTTRNKETVTRRKMFFQAEDSRVGFQTLKKNMQHIDFVINCIGITDPSTHKKDLIFINAFFPHLLEEFAEQYAFNLIHISTDAVFPPLSGEVTESSPPNPIDDYGRSKLLGETTYNNALTIRSSFIGYDPIHHKGLLENVLENKHQFTGFTNQIWAGCTTLQFAQFCRDIIEQNHFSQFRKKSPVIHFTPLGPISKYELCSQFVKKLKNNWKIKKSQGDKRNRILLTKFTETLELKRYKSTVDEVLQSLTDFENYS